jgi:hypothetical protein
MNLGLVVRLHRSYRDGYAIPGNAVVNRQLSRLSIMSKQHPFFRVLRCATIAPLLAAGREGFFFPRLYRPIIALARNSR